MIIIVTILFLLPICPAYPLTPLPHLINKLTITVSYLKQQCLYIPKNKEKNTHLLNFFITWVVYKGIYSISISGQILAPPPDGQGYIKNQFRCIILLILGCLTPGIVVEMITIIINLTLTPTFTFKVLF